MKNGCGFACWSNGKKWYERVQNGILDLRLMVNVDALCLPGFCCCIQSVLQHRSLMLFGVRNQLHMYKICMIWQVKWWILSIKSTVDVLLAIIQFSLSKNVHIDVFADWRNKGRFLLSRQWSLAHYLLFKSILYNVGMHHVPWGLILWRMKINILSLIFHDFET